jgi:outer membrane protein
MEVWMRPNAAAVLLLALAWAISRSAAGQGTSPSAELPGPRGLREKVVEGVLTLAPQDVIELALANDTAVRVGMLSYESARLNVTRARGSFDPTLSGSYDWLKTSSPTTTQLEGADTRSDLSGSGRLALSQTLPTATRLELGFDASRFETNNTFSTFNPSFGSALALTVTQPLLGRSVGSSVRAPVKQAEWALERARSDVEALAGDTALRAVERAFAVIQARESLAVLRKSLELAQETFSQNQRALELGALPPLEIHRSEAQVATRRSQVIQAEFALLRAENELRTMIGADLEPDLRSLSMALPAVEPPVEPLATLDAGAEISRALERRPEIEALRAQLRSDDVGVKVAQNALRPDVSIRGSYTLRGRSGTELDPSVQPPAVIGGGGLSGALDQIGGLDFPTYGVGVQVRIPIPNRTARADLGNALVGRERTLYQLRLREQAIALELTNAANDLEQARQSLAATRLARDLSRKNLDAEQRKYELGVQTIFFVLDAQTQLAQAELSFLRAQIDYHRAVIAAERATGELGRRWVSQLLAKS